MELHDIGQWAALAAAIIAAAGYLQSRARVAATDRSAVDSQIRDNQKELAVMKRDIDALDRQVQSRRADIKALQEQIKVDHSSLRERVDLGFNDTDGMITGVRDMLTDMRGELRGAGVLGGHKE